MVTEGGSIERRTHRATPRRRILKIRIGGDDQRDIVIAAFNHCHCTNQRDQRAASERLADDLLCWQVWEAAANQRTLCGTDHQIEIFPRDQRL